MMTASFDPRLTGEPGQATATHDGRAAPCEATIHGSLADIDEASWNSLFPGDVEGYELYRALEDVPPPGFTLGAIAASAGQRLVAAAPMFQTAYRLDTPFQGRAHRIADWIDARVPGLTRINVVGIGSPMSDNCSIGLAPDLSLAERRQAARSLVDRLMQTAAERRAAIVAVKSLADGDHDFHQVLTAAGFERVTSVPVVTLALPYVSLEHYLAALPAKTGRYLERKRRAAGQIRIEYRDDTAGIEEALNRLLASTLAQSGVEYGEFGEVHPSYFSALMRGLGPRARLMLCWKDDELLSFQVYLVGEKRIIANKIGMKYPEAREYNLYFVNFLAMIEDAIQRGIPEIEMGATAYTAKLLFGGRIDRRWLYFRFRNGLFNRLAAPLAPLFDFERNDPELKRIAAAAAVERTGKSPSGADPRRTLR